VKPARGFCCALGHVAGFFPICQEGHNTALLQDQGSLPMDQPAITGRFSSRTPVDTVPKPKGPGPHQFPPSLRPTDVLLKKIGLTDWLCEPCPSCLAYAEQIKGLLCDVMFVLIHAVCGMRMRDGIA
jgi:hypothetical protein